MRLFFVSLLLCGTLMAADFEMMTKEEQKKTGMSKLSSKEKEALMEWISQHYVARGDEEAMMNGSPVQRQKTPVLSENFNSGKFIRLSDGTLWEINPKDTPITQGWVSPVEIQVSSSGHSNYPFKLTNTLSGSSVFARKATGIPPNPKPSTQLQTPAPTTKKG